MAPINASLRQLARGLLHDTSDLTARSPIPSPTPDDFASSSRLSLSLRSLISRLSPRAATGVTTVPQGYGQTPSGPDTGTIVGITLGSVAGFLLVLWLIYTCVNLGNGPATVVETASVGGATASVVTRKSRKHRKHRHASPRRETVEIRRERVVPVQERIIVEERSRSRGPPIVPPPPPIIDDDEDEVVVIEEHSPPPRRRESRQARRSSERRSGYRDVDPRMYGGGDGPVRDVSSRRRSSGSRR